MNKAERKRRAQELKRKAKLAKRAKREADSPSGDGRESTPVTSDQDNRAPEQVEQPAVAADTDEKPAETSARPEGSQAADARETPVLQDEIHAAHAKLNWAESDVLEGELSAQLGDDEAVELLTKAARALGDVIDFVQDLIERLPKDQVADAIRIQNRPRSYTEKSRNGANPVVQLLNILLRAKGLMIRVVKQTNPELAKRMQAAKAK